MVTVWDIKGELEESKLRFEFSAKFRVGRWLRLIGPYFNLCFFLFFPNDWNADLARNDWKRLFLVFKSLKFLLTH